MTRNSFDIGETSGAITSTATHDFEDQGSYSLVIVATSGGTSATDRGDPDRTRIAKLSVTVMVVDAEDAGSVDLSAREPQVGRSVIATLDDDDGGETAISWQWYRGGADPEDADSDGAISDAERLTLITALRALVHDPELDTNNVCGDEDGTAVSPTQACVNRWSHVGPLHAGR